MTVSCKGNANKGYKNRSNKMIKDTIVDGFQNAPHRSLYHALGLTDEELSRPLIGIVSSYNEIVPGHMNLDKITDAVKRGVAMAGGTPIMFPAITVCDGIAMGHVGMKYSLVTRDLIADSTEAMVMAHGFDGLVMIPNCDKNVPGLLMAAARLNIPTVFVSGGPMLAGHVGGKKRSLSSMFEAVGAYTAGKINEEQLCEFERKVCPTCGSCSGMYTANSMNCLTEVLGMGLRGNGTVPAVYSARIELAKHAGMQVMDLVRKNIRPRDIMTEAAIRNAITADMALGCSTNSMLHLPAIANECGVPFSLDEVNVISEKTPNLCHLAPAGPTYMEDLNEAGGVYAVLKELEEQGLIDTTVMTCTGKTLHENIADAVNLDTARLTILTAQPAASRFCTAISHPTAVSSREAPLLPKCWCTRDLPRFTRARRKPLPQFTAARSSRVTWWSFVTRAPQADRVCARCCLPPRRSQAWDLTRTLR